MADTRTIYLAVIGVGGVGSKVLHQLYNIQEASTPRPKSLTQLRLVYLARSSRAVVSNDHKGIPLETWQDSLQQSSSSPLVMKELVDFLVAAPGPAVLVDNTSNPDIAVFYPMVLRAGVSVVTPSKLAFAGGLGLWRDIFSAASNGQGPADAGMVLHESTCGAGLPTISTVKDLVKTGNSPTRIEGILSGTLSYLFNSYMPASDPAGPISFSSLVTKARDMGYTEPDPRADLSGLDVARKCTILARLCGVDLPSSEAVAVRSLIPLSLQTCKDGDDFVEQLTSQPEHDKAMDALKQQAASTNKVLRYAAVVDVSTGKCSVELRPFDLGHPFALGTGDDLQLAIHTNHYKTPIVIKGCGEGAFLGVLTDLLRVCEAFG